MKVIVAIDQTVKRQQIIEAVLKQPWEDDSSFKLLTVLQPIEWQDAERSESDSLVVAVMKKREKIAHQILLSARERFLQVLPNCAIHTELRHGSAKDEIVKAAVEWEANKIILGAHDSLPNRLLPGSVAHSVHEHVACEIELVELKKIASMVFGFGPG